MVLCLMLMSLICLFVCDGANCKRTNEKETSHGGFDVTDWIVAVSIVVYAVSMVTAMVLAIIAIPNSKAATMMQVAVFEEENKKIEQRLSKTVDKYTEMESLPSMNSDDVISIVGLYPELYSNEFVQQQTNAYAQNSEKVLELKEAYAKNKSVRWWLYFDIGN